MQDITLLDRTQRRKLLKTLEDEFYGVGNKNPDILIELLLTTGPIQAGILKYLSYIDIKLLKQTCPILLSKMGYIYCGMGGHVIVNGECQCKYKKQITISDRFTRDITFSINLPFILVRSPLGKTIKYLKQSLGINDHPNRAARRLLSKTKNNKYSNRNK
jgi:hypothetical protein